MVLSCVDAINIVSLGISDYNKNGLNVKCQQEDDFFSTQYLLHKMKSVRCRGDVVASVKISRQAVGGGLCRGSNSVLFLSLRH